MLLFYYNKASDCVIFNKLRLRGGKAMKQVSRVLLLFILFTSIVMFLAGCSSSNAADEGQYIIDAKTLNGYIGKAETVIVDMQKPEDYAKAHVAGAVNIPLGEIVINQPVANMLAPKDQIEKVLGAKGISNNSMILIYDNNKNMEAARLWWTLKMYGHDNAKVVSGGMKAIELAKLELTAEKPSVTAVNYTAKDKDIKWLSTIDEVKLIAENPSDKVILLDTRSNEEYAEGFIPNAVLYNFEENNFKDGTYKPVDHIKLQYMEDKITPDKEIVMYCKTSVRAAQSFLALYNAGYRNLKVYDGAWLEWELSQKPVEPEVIPAIEQPAAEIAPAPAVKVEQNVNATEKPKTPEKKPEVKPAEPVKKPEAKPAPAAPPVDSNNQDAS